MNRDIEEIKKEAKDQYKKVIITHNGGEELVWVLFEDARKNLSQAKLSAYREARKVLYRMQEGHIWIKDKCKICGAEKEGDKIFFQNCNGERSEIPCMCAGSGRHCQYLSISDIEYKLSKLEEEYPCKNPNVEVK